MRDLMAKKSMRRLLGTLALLALWATPLTIEL